MATKKAKKKSTKKAAKPRLGARRQPETLRLRKLTPGFTATDLQRSMAFYRDVLGFVIGDEWREDGSLTGCEIHAGAVTFVLTQDDFAKGRVRAKGVGARIWCSTAQDLDRLAADIKARGGALDQEPQDMPWGQRVFMIADPDGFKFTFVQER